MAKIIIGYSFVFFHIKITGFDLLPDCVGYVLVFLGLGGYPEVVNFTKAKPMTAVMAAASLANIFWGTFGRIPLLSFVIDVVLTSASLYILYLIDMGVREMEQSTGLELRFDKLLYMWKFQAVFSLGALALSLIPNQVVATIAGIHVVAGFAANIMFLVHLNAARKTLKNHVKNE